MLFLLALMLIWVDIYLLAKMTMPRSPGVVVAQKLAKDLLVLYHYYPVARKHKSTRAIPKKEHTGRPRQDRRHRPPRDPQQEHQRPKGLESASGPVAKPLMATKVAYILPRLVQEQPKPPSRGILRPADWYRVAKPREPAKHVRFIDEEAQSQGSGNGIQAKKQASGADSLVRTQPIRFAQDQDGQPTVFHRIDMEDWYRLKNLPVQAGSGGVGAQTTRQQPGPIVLKRTRYKFN